ncbi:clusterin-like protein 1 [Cheilinus undulatus]|uniref:clusterin-like protein 1 n=1 Tax=Cheilinus undulatus TaxID=241271 RepID=UPI001BD31DC1|nr:clusterin-like protein 1 [Cheilinus undulatus]
MRRLLVHILCISQALLCAADSPPLSEEALEGLSAAGEHFVNEEIKRSVLGVKQVRELMEEKEKKHRHFMDALRQSSDKKKGAMQLARESEQKLEEAERQCRDLTKSLFEECRPCLEDTCKNFYASTCRRGFTSFSYKVEEFFKTLAAQLEETDHFFYQDEENTGYSNLAENPQLTGDEADLQQVDLSFSQLLLQTNVLFNQSVSLVTKMQQAFGHSFLLAFTAELHPSPLSATWVRSGPGFFRSLGLDQTVDSVKNGMGEIGSSVVDIFEDENSQQPNKDTGFFPGLGQLQSRHLCRRLRRQTSECLHLGGWCETCKEYFFKECPIVQQLHSEVEEMHLLLNASREQYDDRLQLVRRHTADTQSWLSNMEDKYRWVSHLSEDTDGPDNIFSVIAVTSQPQMKTIRLKTDSIMLVTVLDSAPFAVSVPAELEVDDPAFVQYAAQEALTLYKRQIRGMK